MPRSGALLGDASHPPPLPRPCHLASLASFVLIPQGITDITGWLTVPWAVGWWPFLLDCKLSEKATKSQHPAQGLDQRSCSINVCNEWMNEWMRLLPFLLCLVTPSLDHCTGHLSSFPASGLSSSTPLPGDHSNTPSVKTLLGLPETFRVQSSPHQPRQVFTHQFSPLPLC